MGFFDIFKKPAKLYTHLDEDTIKQNEIIKNQQQEIASRDAQIIKLLNEVNKTKVKKTDEQKQNEINKKLKEQKQLLDTNKYGKVVKLSKFYKHFLKDKKFRDSLEICDKNDEVVLGKFGDFGIMEGGKLALLDKEGELMAYGKSLSHILYKPDAFENMARRKRFLIPRDKDGNFMEDLEYKEIPEPLDAQYDEQTGRIKQIKWSKVKTSEVKKVIADKMEQINNLHAELEDSEDLVKRLNSRVTELERALKINQTSNDLAQSQLSNEIEKFLNSNKAISAMHSEVTHLTEEIATLNTLIAKKDGIIETLIAKLDKTGDPQVDIIKQRVLDDLQLYKSILPKTIEVHKEQEPLPVHQTQPREVIK